MKQFRVYVEWTMVGSYLVEAESKEAAEKIVDNAPNNGAYGGLPQNGNYTGSEVRYDLTEEV
jgi:hypothetical protein